MSNITSTATQKTTAPSRYRNLSRRLRRDPLAILSIIILSIIFLCAIAPDYIATHSYIRPSIDRLMPPSGEYIMGTDQFGRDIFSRTVVAAQVSLGVGLITVALALVLGIPLGAIAGFYGPGWIDTAIMRIMDVMLAFPPIILAIAVIAALGTEAISIGPLELPHISKLMFVIGILYVPQVARVVRSAVLVEKNEQYVMAERALGASRPRILFRDVLRNCISPISVQGTVLIANAIIAEASLSFLGLGVQPPHPSWGGMLADARTYVQSGEWWLTVFPGILIFLTVCSLNILGDFLRDILDTRTPNGE